MLFTTGCKSLWIVSLVASVVLLQTRGQLDPLLLKLLDNLGTDLLDVLFALSAALFVPLCFVSSHPAPQRHLAGQLQQDVV